MNLISIARRVAAADVIPIERHKRFKKNQEKAEPTVYEDEHEVMWVQPSTPSFSFKPAGNPDPELIEHYEENGVDPDPSEVEAINHLLQLAQALSKGHIGFEWYSKLAQQELSKAGW